MGLIRFIQDHNRNMELKEINKIKRMEVDLQRQKEQQPLMKTMYCPYCGKLIEIKL